VAFFKFSPAELGATQFGDFVSDAPVERSMYANCEPLTVVQAWAFEKATRHAPVDTFPSPTGPTYNVAPAALISAADHVASEFPPAIKNVIPVDVSLPTVTKTPLTGLFLPSSSTHHPHQ
jgi:hypothetical protein